MQWVGEKRKTSYLLQAKPRRKWKHVLFVGLLTSILHGLMGIRSSLVKNSLGRCLHPLLVYSESLPAPLLGSLVSTEGVVIFSCKERWGMGIQGVLHLKINDSFSWVFHCEIVVLVLPERKSLQHWDDCIRACLDQVWGQHDQETAFADALLFMVWAGRF